MFDQKKRILIMIDFNKIEKEALYRSFQDGRLVHQDKTDMFIYLHVVYNKLKKHHLTNEDKIFLRDGNFHDLLIACTFLRLFDNEADNNISGYFTILQKASFIPLLSVCMESYENIRKEDKV
jgi:hypothetical protein